MDKMFSGRSKKKCLEKVVPRARATAEQQRLTWSKSAKRLRDPSPPVAPFSWSALYFHAAFRERTPPTLGSFYLQNVKLFFSFCTSD